MKFRFNLETLLKHRKNIERAAMKQFAESQGRLTEALQYIQDLYAGIDEGQAKLQRLRNEGSTGAEQEIVDSMIRGQRVRIQKEKEHARTLMMDVEEKREILVEASREFHVLARLKEKKHEEFRRAKRKKEEKTNDELSTLRFRLTKKGNLA